MSRLRMAFGKYVATTTRSQYTRDFRHLENPSIISSNRFPVFASVAVPPIEDRVKYWNIVPGDRVRIRGDRSNTVHEVYSINKFTNHVFLRGIKSRGEGQETLKPFRYQNLQLLVDNFEFPPKPGSDKPEVVPVFARRVAKSPPVWAYDGSHRWSWTRYAAATDPPIPGWNKADKLEIPWPEPIPEVPIPDPTPYDTLEEDARRVTYVPPAPTVSLTEDVANAYLESLRTPETYDASLPIEHFLAAELANPHSRAKKQKRWQEKQARLKKLRADILAEQLANLDGRTRSDARAEAEWRFRERVIQEKKDERLRRAIARGALARVEKKKIRRAKKEARRIRQLRETVLVEEENQVLPGTSTLNTPYSIPSTASA